MVQIIEKRNAQPRSGAEPFAPSRGAWGERPFLVLWEATRACALACRHCRAEAVPRRNAGELAGEEFHGFLEQVAEAGPAIFVITGGDPACRPDLVEIVSEASQLGLRVALSPSATPRWLRQDLSALKRAGLARISLSLDGATAASHDAFRGVPGTWRRTMQALQAAKEAGLSVQINTTITRQNLSEWPQFQALLPTLEPATWSLFMLVPTGRAALEDLPSAEQTEDLFERLADWSEEVSFGIKTTEGHHYRRVLRQRGKLRADSPGQQGIADGRGVVFVSHTGEVFPSGFLPLSAGSVRDRRLAEIYREAPLFQQLRHADSLRGKCGRCPYKSLCGGSRARAYAMTGDYLASDPLCSYQPPADTPQLTSTNLPCST
jgi:radical SAM protein with 4Fe4S-binding SPASM domain